MLLYIYINTVLEETGDSENYLTLTQWIDLKALIRFLLMFFERIRGEYFVKILSDLGRHKKF